MRRAIAAFFVMLPTFSHANGTVEYLNKTIQDVQAKWRTGQTSSDTSSAWAAVKSNSPGALKKLEGIAKKGDPDALNLMGWLYDNGEYGVAVNPSSAVQYFKTAANLGNDVAIYNIGVLTYYGRGTPLSVGAAYQWFARASESKIVVRACVRAAVLGIQTKENATTISSYVQCATDRNSATGFFLRGRLDYQAGRFESASGWLTKAAEAMEPNAPWLISRLYSQNPGLVQDNVLAAGWWAIGARLNPKKTAVNATGLNSFGLTDEQRQRANHFAEQWISNHSMVIPINYAKTIVDARD